MITEVRLHVDGLDLEDEQTLDVIAENFADYLWASSDGLVTFTVYVESVDVAGVVIQAVRGVESRLAGAKVRRVQRDLVTASDIAGRVGVSREAVRKWTQRGGGDAFPAPFDTVGSEDRPSKVWLWSEVLLWLERVCSIDMGEHLPDEGTVAHINACLEQVESYLDRHWKTAKLPTEASPAQEQLLEVLRRWQPVSSSVSRSCRVQADFSWHTSQIFVTESGADRPRRTTDVRVHTGA